jgi:hypothetical protein
MARAGCFVTLGRHAEHRFAGPVILDVDPEDLIGHLIFYLRGIY